MNLKYKKILAKEILVIVALISIGAIIYFAAIIYEKNIITINSKISTEILSITGKIKIKKDSILILRPPIDLTSGNEILHPEKYNKNGRPKFDPNKEYEIYDEFGIKKKVNSENERLKITELKNQIFQLVNQQRLLKREQVQNIDVKTIVKKSFLFLFVLGYPIRLLILASLWSMKILKIK